MKAANVKSQERKKTIWDYLSRHFGKAFWIMTIWCVSCTANTSIPAMLPVTGGEVKADIVFSPDRIDFGIRELNSVSMAKKVTIRNDGAEPLLINKLTATAGFSLLQIPAWRLKRLSTREKHAILRSCSSRTCLEYGRGNYRSNMLPTNLS